MKKSAAMTFTDFIYEVNHKLMGDFVSMSNDEVGRFMKMEKLLEVKSHAAFSSAGWIRMISVISWSISTGIRELLTVITVMICQ